MMFYPVDSAGGLMLLTYIHSLTPEGQHKFLVIKKFCQIKKIP